MLWVIRCVLPHRIYLSTPRELGMGARRATGQCVSHFQRLHTADKGVEEWEHHCSVHNGCCGVHGDWGVGRSAGAGRSPALQPRSADGSVGVLGSHFAGGQQLSRWCCRDTHGYHDMYRVLRGPLAPLGLAPASARIGFALSPSPKSSVTAAGSRQPRSPVCCFPVKSCKEVRKQPFLPRFQ